MRRKIFNTTNGLSYGMLSSLTPQQEIIAPDLQAQVNFKNGPYGNVFSGYFVAPATAAYRFMMSCDDVCQIKFSNVSMDPTQAQVVLSIGSHTSYRAYNYVFGDQLSTAWMNLTQGEAYFFEVDHIQGYGGDHLTVALEI